MRVRSQSVCRPRRTGAASPVELDGDAVGADGAEERTVFGAMPFRVAGAYHERARAPGAPSGDHDGGPDGLP